MKGNSCLLWMEVDGAAAPPAPPAPSLGAPGIGHVDDIQRTNFELEAIIRTLWECSSLKNWVRQKQKKNVGSRKKRVRRSNISPIHS